MNEFQFSLRDRLYYWWRGKFIRQKCDGCANRFIMNHITPVSGDYWLCELCFLRWYPEFAKGVKDET